MHCLFAPRLFLHKRQYLSASPFEVNEQCHSVQDRPSQTRVSTSKEKIPASEPLRCSRATLNENRSIKFLADSDRSSERTNVGEHFSPIQHRPDIFPQTFLRIVLASLCGRMKNFYCAPLRNLGNYERSTGSSKSRYRKTIRATRSSVDFAIEPATVPLG